MGAVLLIAGLGLFCLMAPAILMLKALIYLKDGAAPHWTLRTVIGPWFDGGPRMTAWWDYPTDWIGLHRLLAAVLDVDIAAIVAAIGIIIAFVGDILNRENT